MAKNLLPKLVSDESVKNPWQKRVGSTGHEFVLPVQWLLMLLNDDIVL